MLFTVDSLLPVNFKPSSIVATSRTMFLPLASWIGLPLASFGTYTIRSALSVSALWAGSRFTRTCSPLADVMEMLAPSRPLMPSLPFWPWGPVIPMEPSLPLITTEEPSLPFTPILPSTPSLPATPGWPFSPIPISSANAYV